jgi:hypothetical protein
MCNMTFRLCWIGEVLAGMNTVAYKAKVTSGLMLLKYKRKSTVKPSMEGFIPADQGTASRLQKGGIFP